VQAFYAEHRELLEQGKYTATPADIQRIRDLYYGGVSQADLLIGGLLDELRAQGVLDDTLVIVTSDHGESLGEEQGASRLWEHNHMVQTNLRIPLLMRYPKAFPAGTRVAALTDEIDVFPTVVQLAQLQPPPQTGVNDVIDGRDLLPLVRGEARSLRPISFAESAFAAAAQDERWKLIVDVQRLKGAEGTYKDRLFDLQADAAEQHNLAAEHPEQVERLLAALTDWAKAMPKREMERSPRDLEEERRFRELGYTGEDFKPK
jgi:arylsulfatase A-like enzyme